MTLRTRSLSGPGLLLSAVLALLPAACRVRPPAEEKGLDVLLCDGKTTTHVDGPAPVSRSGGQAIADRLMKSWLQAHPASGWEAEERERHSLPAAPDNAGVLAAGQAGDTAGTFTRQDLLIWKRETESLVAEGSRTFHDAGRLGSTIAVSCDMCHPDAANTHPETYPKYQVQLGKVALLRDMINWCVQHPVRAAPLEPDGPRMRALEAYIYAKRAGTPLVFGKH